MKNSSPKNRFWLVIAVLIGISAITVYFFPLFHIVKIETAQQKKDEGKFNAKEFVEKFWNEKLPTALEQATDATGLLTAIKTNPQQAKDQFAKKLGMGNTYYYFVKGEGRIVSVKGDLVGISLAKDGTKPDLVLSTSNIYGNTVRDGSGLFNVNDFPSSQEFNKISAELNKRIETDVLPNLKQNAKVGATINFAGCAEISDEKTDLQPLRLIPLKAQIQ